MLVLNFGRLGDMFGRVRMYNLGFLIFTIASILLSIDWMTGRAGAMLADRACASSRASAAPSSPRTPAPSSPTPSRPTSAGLALGINNVASVAGRFLGLVVGGLLAAVDWRLVFFVSVPFGIFGTLWGYFKLEERGVRRPARIDWLGNVTFAIGLILVMVGITYGIQPYGDHVMGWTNPMVLGEIGVGVAFLVAFAVIETRVESPMFRLQLFQIRAFTFGTLSSFLSALARGGLMFMLIIWLQGIWLPNHGYSFDSTPLWAGIFMLPLSVGIVIAGPAVGLPVRPLRRPLLRHRRHADHRARRSSCSCCCRPTSTTRSSAWSSCCAASAPACSPRPTGPRS